MDSQAETDSMTTVFQKSEALPWSELESPFQIMRQTFLEKEFVLGDGFNLTFSKEELLRAAARYGKAVAHTVGIYR